MISEEPTVEARHRAMEPSWVIKGMLSACDCFSCVNKVEHMLKNNRVHILCREPCNYKPRSRMDRPITAKLYDIERNPRTRS